MNKGEGPVRRDGELTARLDRPRGVLGELPALDRCFSFRVVRSVGILPERLTRDHRKMYCLS
jgi:hypothetical protein